MDQSYNRPQQETTAHSGAHLLADVLNKTLFLWCLAICLGLHFLISILQRSAYRETSVHMWTNIKLYLTMKLRA